MGYEDALERTNCLLINYIKECDTALLLKLWFLICLNRADTRCFFCINDEVAAYCLKVVSDAGLRNLRIFRYVASLMDILLK